MDLMHGYAVNGQKEFWLLHYIFCCVLHKILFFSWLQSTLVGNECYETVAVHKPIFTHIQIQVENESFYHGKKKKKSLYRGQMFADEVSVKIPY